MRWVFTNGKYGWHSQFTAIKYRWSAWTARFRWQVLSTFGFQLFGLAIGTLQAVIVARWLGPSGKGILAIVLLIPGILSMLLNAGINLAYVYFVGQRRFALRMFTRHATTFTALGTLLGGVAIAVMHQYDILTQWLPGLSLPFVLFGIALLPVYLLQGYLSAILQGQQRIVVLNIVHSFVLSVLLGGVIGLVVVLPMGVWGVLLAVAISQIVHLTILIRLIQRSGGQFKPMWNWQFIRAALGFGLQGHVGNVFQFFNYRLDMFLVNYFLHPSAVGLYTVATRMAELLWYLPNAVSFVIFPRASTTSPGIMNQLTPRVFAITSGITLVGAITLGAIGSWLIRWLFSEAFADAYKPMLWLLPGVVLLGAAKVLTNEIAGRGFPIYNSIGAAVALVLTVLLDLWWIPRHGIQGAAAASSVAYAAVFCCAIGFFFHVRRRTHHRDVKQPKTTSCIEHESLAG